MVIPRTVVASHAKDLVIKAGPQTLTGAQALAYARERKTLPDGDFGRSRHQGEVILAAAVKAKLAGPAAIPSALTSFSEVGESDLSAEQILTFTAGLHTLNPLQVGRGVAKGRFGTAAGQSIVVLGAEARRLFAVLPRREPLVTRAHRRHAPRCIAARARTADVRGIRDLVAPLAERRVLVSKEAVTYFESLQEFRVAELDGRIVGCGALHVMWEDLAEIRTLAVAGDMLGTGLGGRLLEELVDDARQIGVERLFCLTFEVGFFSRHGFTEIEGQAVSARGLRRAAALLRRGRGRVPRPRAGQAQHPRQPPDAAHPLDPS